MNFQFISPVENAEKYLDIAFAAAKVQSSRVISKGLSEVARQRKKQITKIETVTDKLLAPLKTIVIQFPRFDELIPFYQELFICYIKEVEYKQDLSKIKWAELQIKKFYKKYYGLLRANNDEKLIVKLTSEFYGRVSSVMKQIAQPLKNMTVYRKHLRSFPAIKEGCLDICLFGFPNVGKSTLLSKLTTANPEIANYAFTTKGINVGYADHRNIKLQVIDTPGTLNRFEKMNDIEKMAYLVLTKLADIVVYVFDPTKSYSLEKQEALYEVAKESPAKVFVYLSKTDIADEESIKEFQNKFDCISFDELQTIFGKEADKKEISFLKNQESELQKQIDAKEIVNEQKSKSDVIKKLRRK